MVVKKLPEIDPPSGRVLGQGLLAIPISGSRRRRNSGEIRDTGFLSRVSGTGSKYRRKGGTGGGPLHPGGHLARPGVGPRRQAAWAGGGPPSVILEASVMLIFYIFLLEFLELCKYG